VAESLEELQAALAALNKARASGISVVSYLANGVSRSVTYKHDAEMREAQNDLMRRIAAFQGNTSRTIKISASKGLDHYER
jgi:uncharacterized membrane-anchored protein